MSDPRKALRPPGIIQDSRPENSQAGIFGNDEAAYSTPQPRGAGFAWSLRLGPAWAQDSAGGYLGRRWSETAHRDTARCGGKRRAIARNISAEGFAGNGGGYSGGEVVIPQPPVAADVLGHPGGGETRRIHGGGSPRSGGSGHRH
jgi:hypothetical protein